MPIFEPSDKRLLALLAQGPGTCYEVASELHSNQTIIGAKLEALYAAGQLTRRAYQRDEFTGQTWLYGLPEHL